MSKLMEAIGGGAVSTGMGLALAGYNDKRQLNQQRKLTDMQEKAQMRLNEQNQKLNFKMWENTNYGAQREHMEKAGLNVGLMYGMGGGGGATVGNAGGSISGGSAPVGGGEVGMALQNGMQMQLLNAQKENIEADTKNKLVDADKKAGVDTANVEAGTENTKANTILTQMNTANAQLQNEIGNKTIDEVVNGIKANADKAQSEARTALVGANVSEETQSSTEARIKSEAMNEAFKLTLMKSNVNLNDEKARAVTQELAQEWERLSIELDKVGVSKMQNAINEFTAKVQARLGQGNLNMRGIEAGLNAAGKILGGGKKIDASGSRSTTVNNY